MTPNQTLVPFPEFANAGTKIQPDAAKYAAGFIPSEVLPAEWLNWFLSHSSTGQTALNEGVASMEKEINNVLQAANRTPSLALDNQLVGSIKKFINDSRKDITVTTDPDVAPAATDIGLISELYAGLRLSVLLKNGFYTDDNTGELTLAINSLGIKKIFVPKDGEAAQIAGTTVDRGDGRGSKYWFAQPLTKFEVEYDPELDEGNGGWLVTNNPIVLSNSSSTNGYTVYSDGKIRQCLKALSTGITSYSDSWVTVNVSFPITMPDKYYAISISCRWYNNNEYLLTSGWRNKTTTGFELYVKYARQVDIIVESL